MFPRPRGCQQRFGEVPVPTLRRRPAPSRENRLAAERVLWFFDYIIRTDEQIAPARAERFASTHWSVVLVAGQGSGPEARQALEDLCRAYWKPLHAFARHHRRNEADAEDVTQAFFAYFLKRGYLGAADRQRGRFRTFLLTSFRHYLDSEWNRARAAKRGGQHTIVSWEELTATGQARCDPPAADDPERTYDREWAAHVIARAIRRLREEFAAAGKASQFEWLKQFLQQPASEAAYTEVARQMDQTPGAVAVAVHRLRHRYGELVRDEVLQTVHQPTDVDDELRHLREVLLDMPPTEISSGSPA